MPLPAADVQTVRSLQSQPGAEADHEVDARGSDPSENRCPTCGRGDALLAFDEVVYCAACGYASDGARGCT